MSQLSTFIYEFLGTQSITIFGINFQAMTECWTWTTHGTNYSYAESLLFRTI